MSLLAVEKRLNELCSVHVITGTSCGNPLVQGLMQCSTFLLREAIVVHGDRSLGGLQVDTSPSGSSVGSSMTRRPPCT